MTQCPHQDFFERIFPPERADDFFDALYGGAEEGAYDIRLICREITPDVARLAFELGVRPGKCLRCSLTYGLPQVFQRHPIINAARLADETARELGWASGCTWELGGIEDPSPDAHYIPFTIRRAAD